MSEIVYVTVKNVLLGELQTGMMIDKDIHTEQGTILLPRGQILKDIQRTVRLLQQHAITMVPVRLPEQIPELMPLQEREAAAFMTAVDEKCDRLKDEFQHILLSGELQEDVLEERIEETLSAFQADINVMQLMQKESSFFFFLNSVYLFSLFVCFKTILRL